MEISYFHEKDSSASSRSKAFVGRRFGIFRLAIKITCLSFCVRLFVKCRN